MKPKKAEPASKPSARPPENWKSILLGCAVIALVTFLCYLPALKAGFIWDDDSMLTENRLVQSPDGLRAIWLSTQPADYWPLTYSTFWIEWRLWGMKATGYHVTNILLHALSAMLLWRVLRRLQIPGAWLAALVFAVHPVNVESVAWITERKNTLAMIFCALALWAYLKHLGLCASLAAGTAASPRPAATWCYYVLSLFAFTLSLLAKTSAVMLPFVLLGCVGWQRIRGSGSRPSTLDLRLILSLVPFFFVSLVLGLVTVWFQSHRAIAGEIIRTEGFPGRLAGAGWAVWFYLYKALIPVNLSFVYPHWNINPRSAPAYLPGLAFVGCLISWWRCRRTWSGAWLFGIGSFALMLFPVLGFVEIYFHRFSLVADHWQYFSIISVIALVVGGVSCWAQEMTARAAASGQPGWLWGKRICAAAVVAALGLLCWKQTRIYANDETLWRDTLRKNPNCWLALNNLGLILAARDNLPGAKALYLQSLESKPDQSEAHNNLSEVLLAEGRFAEARSHLSQALEAAPCSAAVHYNLGKLLEREGNAAEAIASYRRALDLAPDHAEARNGVGCLLAAQGKLDEALAEFREAIRLDPRMSQACYNAGNASFTKGDLGGAVEFYSAAIRLKPDFVEARYAMAVALTQLGKAQAAIDQFEAILRSQPDDVPALGRLAWILATCPDANVRNGANAARLATRAAELSTNQNPAVLDALAAAYAESGQFTQAVVVANKALQSAATSGKTNLAARIRVRLEGYQSGRPYRE